jgi:hypothetical protein
MLILQVGDDQGVVLVVMGGDVAVSHLGTTEEKV